jgi:hypothetical protein
MSSAAEKKLVDTVDTKSSILSFWPIINENISRDAIKSVKTTLEEEIFFRQKCGTSKSRQRVILIAL